VKRISVVDGVVESIMHGHRGVGFALRTGVEKLAGRDMKKAWNCRGTLDSVFTAATLEIRSSAYRSRLSLT
jgi:hypothetical protein